jgi:hypothetical protein
MRTQALRLATDEEVIITMATTKKAVKKVVKKTAKKAKKK